MSGPSMSFHERCAVRESIREIRRSSARFALSCICGAGSYLWRGLPSAQAQSIAQPITGNARVDELLSRMTLADKLELIHDSREAPGEYQGQAGYLAGVPRLGVYLGAPGDIPAGAMFSPRTLVAFDRIKLHASEAKIVTLHVPLRQLQYWSTGRQSWVIACGKRY